MTMHWQKYLIVILKEAERTDDIYENAYEKSHLPYSLHPLHPKVRWKG